MGKKCCAPNCRSGYKGVSMVDISMHKFHEHWKEKFPRGGGWKVTKNSFICSKHFTDDDFITNSLDKTKSRVKKRTSMLKHKYLKKMYFLLYFLTVLITYQRKYLFDHPFIQHRCNGKLPLRKEPKKKRKKISFWTLSSQLQTLRKSYLH